MWEFVHDVADLKAGDVVRVLFPSGNILQRTLCVSPHSASGLSIKRSAYPGDDFYYMLRSPSGHRTSIRLSIWLLIVHDEPDFFEE